MKKSFFILGILLAITASSCSSSRKTTVTTKTNHQPTASLSQSDLEQGKHLWESNCDRCHKLYAPEARTRQQWELILPRMVKRSKLSDTDGEKVRGYIMSLAKS